MIKRIHLIIALSVMSVALTACDPWSDISDLLTGNWDAIYCYWDKLLHESGQTIIDIGTYVVTSITPLLPTVNLPTVNINTPFMSTAAFFLPISEMSTLIVSILGAILTAYAVVVLLRWLKVLR